MDKLRISDNGRYFVRPDGTPFIWLADTAWTVPAKLKWDDVQHYMKTRKDLHEQAAENAAAGVLLVYFSADTEERIDVSGLFEENVYAGWFNPSDGTLEQLPEKLPVSEGILSIANSSADHLDHVLVLASDPAHIQVPSGNYGGSEEHDELKKVFEW